MTFLEVHVISPLGELYNFKARSVSSSNSAGRFDILPGHANFVTYVSKVPVECALEDGSKMKLDYPVAIIRVGKDKVTIFVDVESSPSL